MTEADVMGAVGRGQSRPSRSEYDDV
jgi:hypothetical protein